MKHANDFIAVGRTRLALALLSFLLLSHIALADSAAPQVTVSGGTIAGATDGGVNVYKGIPYAAPPVGDLRWKEPQPVQPWDGTRECTEFGPSCPQLPYSEKSLYHRPAEPQSEDCLYLNIWSAAKSADERRPVMVWIHGGGLTRGSGSHPVYDGAAFARKGIVLVTINYRLNFFGFLAHPELSAESKHHASGNYGILDQIAALQWVQDNIAAFGGDPENVTIFGESAGSWSVNVLHATPLAKGLFQKAIGESGGQFGLSMFLNREGEIVESMGAGFRSAESQGLDFARRAGCENLEQIRALSTEKILQIFGQMEAEGVYNSRAPVDGWVLPDEVRNIFAKGEQNDVSLIVGSNADEMTSLTDPATHPATMDDLKKYIEADYKGGVDAFLAAYPASTDADVRRAYLDSQRDQRFTLNMRDWARGSAEHGHSLVYLYFFSHHPPVPHAEYFRAYHAAEIAYVFDNLAKLGRTEVTPGEQKLADTLSAYWVNFAKTGNPNAEGLPEWKPYDVEDENYVEFDDPVHSGQHLLKPQLDYSEQHIKVR